MEKRRETKDCGGCCKMSYFFVVVVLVVVVDVVFGLCTILYILLLFSFRLTHCPFMMCPVLV